MGLNASFESYFAGKMGYFMNKSYEECIRIKIMIDGNVVPVAPLRRTVITIFGRAAFCDVYFNAMFYHPIRARLNSMLRQIFFKNSCDLIPSQRK